MNFLNQHFTRHARITCTVCGLLVAFALVVGGEVYRTNSAAGLWSSPAAALGSVALFAVVAAVATIVLLALTRVPALVERAHPKAPPAFFGDWRGLLVMWAALFALWIPCLLAYWPGPFSYDIPTQTNYVFTGHWTTQQPPIHTLIWSLFLRMEGLLGLKAITWYALGQMLFLSWSFAYTLRFLARQGIGRVPFALACAFFALNPVVALIAITPVKDSVLAGVMALLSVGAIRLAANPRAFLADKPACAGFAVCALACCLLRSNMLVAVAAFALVAVIAFKPVRKQVALLVAAPLLVAALIVGPGYSALHISAGSSAIASLPFQQVMNTVRNHAGELPADEIAVVEGVLPVQQALESYNPRFADKVVRLFKGKEGGVSSKIGEIVALGKQWVAWSVRYPGDYADAFLALNVPYWYPFAQTPDPYSERPYIETSVWKETEYYPVQLDSKLPQLHGAYEHVADYSSLANPVTNLLFSPSSVIWVVLAAFVVLYNSGSRRRALLCLLPLLFWASFLIGPVSNMRYVFPLFCLYPLLVCAALQPGIVFAAAGGANGRRA